MDVEFFFHGVPKGQDYRGIEAEKSYFSTFYSNIPKDEIVKYLINVRSVEGKRYCYYHYLYYQSIADCDGRSGSYFGVSIRMDAYCIDILNIYRILECIYHFYVVNHILIKRDGKVEYANYAFSKMEDVFEHIEEVLLGMIQKAFCQENFVPLDSFIIETKKIVLFNLYDCNSEVVMNAIQQNGKCAISPYYQSQREKASIQESENQIQHVKKQGEDEIAALKQENSNKLSQLSHSIELINNQKEELENQLRVAENQLRVAREENYRLKGNSVQRVSQIVSQIREPICELSSFFKKNAPPRQESWAPRVKSIIPFLNFVILIIGIILLFFILSKINSQKDYSETNVNHHEYGVSLPDSNVTNLDDKDDSIGFRE